MNCSTALAPFCSQFINAPLDRLTPFIALAICNHLTHKGRSMSSNKTTQPKLLTYLIVLIQIFVFTTTGVATVLQPTPQLAQEAAHELGLRGAPWAWLANLGGDLAGLTQPLFGAPLSALAAPGPTTHIVAGDSHACMLTSGGGVKCWGYNGYGQLGDGTTTNRETAVDVVGLTSGVIALAGGDHHTCAITSAGGLKCWGRNAYGQLGDGTNTNRTTPVDVSGLGSGVVFVSAGTEDTCALTSAGGVKCWGYNANSQLGDGTTTNRNTPVDAVGLTSGVSDVAAGDYHTCVIISSTGGVKCWGHNANGQLGNGTTTNSTTPVDVTGLTSGVQSITAHYHHTCALTTGGGVKCWGYNGNGMLGDGTTTNRSTPVNVSGLTSGVAAIADGQSFHSCAITSGGAAKCWGYNGNGMLGDGTYTQRLTSVDVLGLSSGVKEMVGGDYFTCALMETELVSCWGYNASGQLGDGTTTQRNTPLGVSSINSLQATTGPGGVTANLRFWIKAGADAYADAGVTLATDGQTIQQWNNLADGGIYNVTQASAGARPTYYSTTAANLINFNPALSFNGSNELYNNAEIYDNTHGWQAFSLAEDRRTNIGQVRGSMGIGDNGNDPALDLQTDGVSPNGLNFFMDGSSPAELGGGVDSVAQLYNGNTGGANQQPQIFAFGSNNVVGGASNIVSHVDGFREATDMDSAQEGGIGGGLWIGSSQDAQWIGLVAESIIYDRQLTTAELQRVNSYLAIKYGVTLDESYASSTTNFDYIAADGATITWPGTSDATFQPYHNDVAGIGRDDITALDQRKSQSVNIDALVAIDNGGAFAADNSFLVWGNNDGSTDYDTLYTPTGFTPAATTYHMGRIWRVAETGSGGNPVAAVTVQGPTTAGYLLVDNDGNFSDGNSTEIPLSAGSATVDFSNGQYFTFVRDAIAPGGVDANLRLWVKADAGTGTTTAGAGVTTWEDQSVNEADMTVTVANRTPTYQAAAVSTNYNPSLLFDGVNSGMELAPFMTGAEAGGSVFGAAANDTPGTGYDNLVSFGVDNPHLGTAVTTGKALGYMNGSSPIRNDHPAIPIASQIHLWGWQWNMANEPSSTTSNTGLDVIFNGEISSAPTMELRESSFAQGAPSPDEFQIGSYEGAEPWDGKISEVIVYDRNLTTVESQRVHSYLAIKYGTTLDTDPASATANFDYLAADGTTIIWPGTSDAAFQTYHNDVAGIGRDDASALDQRKSHSVDSDALVTMDNGGAFAADPSFLLWGNDNGATTVTTAVTGAANTFRMGRIWRAQETGTVDSVLAQIPTSAITLGAGEAAFIVRSSDATFTVADAYKHMPVNGSNYERSVDFASGDYFTFVRGPDTDTDGDGVLDLEDIDDDNDGILDSTEGFAAVNSDADSIPDSLDLDSDNDGIPDNIEAQSTAGYVAPTGSDSDGDGLDDAYEPAGLTPVNTDGADNPDYLDTDSDNAETDDTTEAGLTLNAFDDPDGDGLDNDVDSDDAAFGPPNAGIASPAATYPDSNGTGDVDYRELAIPPDITSDGGGATAALSLAENIAAVTTVTASGDPTIAFSIVGGTDAAAFAIDSVTGALTFVAAPDFEAPADSDTNNTYEVIVRASNAGGTDDQTITVTITDVPDTPPVITSDGGGATAALSVPENTIGVTTVTASGAPAPTFGIVGGTDQLRFAIDTTSGVLTFLAPPDFEAPSDSDTNNTYVVIVRATNATGSDDQTITVTVTDVPDTPPTITSDGGGDTAALNLAENNSAVTTVTSTGDPIPTFSIVGGTDQFAFAVDSSTGDLTFLAPPDFETPTDSDGNNTYEVIVRATNSAGTDDQTITVTITNVADTPPDITSDGGGITAVVNLPENNTAVTTVTSDGDPIPTFSIVGGTDQLSFVIDSTTGDLAFAAPPDFEAPSDSDSNNTYQVVVRATNSAGADDQTITVTITDVPDTPPTIFSDGGGDTAALSMVENNTAATTVQATGDPVPTYTIVGGTDQFAFAIDNTTGDLSFLAIPDFEAPADSNTDNVYEVIVRATNSAGTDDQTITITITDVPDTPPTIFSDGGAATASLTVPENNTPVTTVQATADPVATYSIVGGADQLSFVIDSTTGDLAFAAPPDFEAPSDSNGDNVYEVIVRATNSAGTDDQTINVTVTDVPDTPPVITSDGGAATASLSMPENNPAVTTVAATGDPVPTFTIVGGTDQFAFAIDNTTGDLTFLAPPDFEAPSDSDGDNVYQVIVRATNSAGTDDQTISVTITNVPDIPPTIVSDGGGATASLTMPENNSAVTTVASTGDPVFTYSVIGGTDALAFVIDSATGDLSFAAPPDFEAPTDSDGNNTYEVIVQSSNAFGTDSQTITVTITDVPDTPPVITSDGGAATAALSMPEGNTAVTTVAATGDPIPTFSIVGGADQLAFVIDSTSGDLAFAAPPDFEAPSDSGGINVYTVIVRATNSAGADDQTITVTITDVPDTPPTIFSDGGGATASLSMPENNAAATTVQATGDPIPTYTIVGGTDQFAFAIDNTTGDLTFLAAPDLEAPADSNGDNVYEVIVRATNSAGTDDQTITITITDVPDTPPTITSDGGAATAALSMPENNTAVTTVAATGDPIPTYSIVGGTDQLAFVIDPTTGDLAFAAPPDFEAPTDSDGDNIYEVIVRATNSAGTDDQTITVTITDVPDTPPIITSDGGGATASLSLPENDPAVTTVQRDRRPRRHLHHCRRHGCDCLRDRQHDRRPDLPGPARLRSTRRQRRRQCLRGHRAGEQQRRHGRPDDHDYDHQCAGHSAHHHQRRRRRHGQLLAARRQPGRHHGRWPAAIRSWPTASSAAPTNSISSSTPPPAISPSPPRPTLKCRWTATRIMSTKSSCAPQRLWHRRPDDHDYDHRCARHATHHHQRRRHGHGSLTMPEGNSAVTTVAATGDPVPTFSIVGGTDVLDFVIDNTTGALSFVTAPDFEAPADSDGDNVYQVIVRATNSAGVDDQTITVTITDVPDTPPTIFSDGGGATANVIVPENTLAATTVQATGDPAPTYTIVGGADAAAFTIDAVTGDLTFVSAPDFEAPTDSDGNNTYLVDVRADNGFGVSNQTITVTVTDVPDTPPDITSDGGAATAAISLLEGNTTATTVSATGDPAAVYSIVGGTDAAAFAIDPATGDLTFVATPDFEAPADSNGDNVYEVIVRASNSAGTDDQTITITITDLADTPPDITSDGGGATAAISLAENDPAVTTVVASGDPAPTFGIVGGADAAAFVIDSVTGDLTFVSAPDFETPIDNNGDNVYEVVVRATNSTGTDDQTITVTVTDVADTPPDITSDGGGSTAAISVPEQQTSVTTVVATAAPAATFSIVGGTDAGSFNLDITTGVLTFVTAPDFEAPTDSDGNNTYEIIVRANNALGTDDQTITVTVTNVPEIDTDNDGIPDNIDPDDDNDGIPDVDEGDGVDRHAMATASPTAAIRTRTATASSTPSNAPALTCVDTDGDGTPDFQDTDSDGDGNPDATEGTGDVDGDGIPNYIDGNDNDGPLGDLDGDGIPNGVEGSGDTDGDGIPDNQDTRQRRRRRARHGGMPGAALPRHRRRRHPRLPGYGRRRRRHPHRQRRRRWRRQPVQRRRRQRRHSRLSRHRPDHGHGRRRPARQHRPRR